MNAKISKELVMHRIEQSKRDLADAKLLYNNNRSMGNKILMKKLEKCLFFLVFVL